MHAAQVGDVYLEFLEASHAMLCYKALPDMGREVIHSPLYIFPLCFFFYRKYTGVRDNDSTAHG
jgi:hypothetical protein